MSDEMDKKTETIAARVTTETSIAAGVIAELRGKTLSQYLADLIDQDIRSHRATYMQLRRVFAAAHDERDLRG